MGFLWMIPLLPLQNHYVTSDMRPSISGFDSATLGVPLSSYILWY